MAKKKKEVKWQKIIVTTIDLDDQIVVSIDSIEYSGKWLFDTKNSDLTGSVNHLWRPDDDYIYSQDEHITHTTSAKLHVDNNASVTYNGTTYYALSAPFAHEIIF